MLIVHLLSQAGFISSFQIPWRFAGRVPGRLLAMQQVAAVLEEQPGQPDVGSPGPHPTQPVVRRQRGQFLLLRRQLQVETDPLEHGPVLRDVFSPKSVVAHRGGVVDEGADLVGEVVMAEVADDN